MSSQGTVRAQKAKKEWKFMNQEEKKGHVLDSTAWLMLVQPIIQLTMNAQNTSS